jgi:hypothetical protein
MITDFCTSTHLGHAGQMEDAAFQDCLVRHTTETKYIDPGTTKQDEIHKLCWKDFAHMYL